MKGDGKMTIAVRHVPEDLYWRLIEVKSKVRARDWIEFFEIVCEKMGK